jgi:heterodisulfide reductase subunit B
VEKIRTLHLLEIIEKMVGLEEVTKRVNRPLRGLKVASYYGCVLVRPPKVTGIDDTENPRMMDRLMAALGAEPVEYSYKIDCCGGSLTLTRTEIAEKLVADIVRGAREAGANCLATACPLCQSNLDGRQTQAEPRMPTLYFTELLGIALGASESKTWFKKHIIDPTPLLKSLRLL